MLTYDFKLKGERILKGCYPELLPPFCDLTLKWSNFFPIGWISGLEKYVMFQHQVCLFPRKILTLSVFHDFNPQNRNFWLFFKLNSLYWWETDKVKKRL